MERVFIYNNINYKYYKILNQFGLSKSWLTFNSSIKNIYLNLFEHGIMSSWMKKKLINTIANYYYSFTSQMYNCSSYFFLHSLGCLEYQ